MERFFEIFKRHPMWIAGAVAAVVIVIYLVSRGSGSSTGSAGIVAYGPSDAVVEADAATEMARINANAATAQAQYALEANSDNNDAAVMLNGQNTDAAVVINGQNAGAAVNINAAQVAGATAINAANANAAVTLGSQSTQVELGQQATDIQLHQIDATTATKEASLNAQTSVLASLLATNPKGGSSTFTDANGVTSVIGINNRNPFGSAR